MPDSSPDFPFAVTTHGPSNAPAIVFLHGFMGSGEDFAPIAQRLAPAKRCVCVTLPGHGGLEMPEEPLSLPRLAASLRDIVLEPLERPALVGYSMGGRLALQTALDHPSSTGSVVLLSTSPGIARPDLRAKRRRRDRSRAKEIHEDLSGFLERWYQLPIFGQLPDAHGYSDMLARRLENDPDHLARVIVELSPGRQPSNWPRLDQLDGAIWIVGAEDPKYAAMGEDLAARGHEVRVAPAAGHALHVEQPDWLAATLAELL